MLVRELPMMTDKQAAFFTTLIEKRNPSGLSDLEKDKIDLVKNCIAIDADVTRSMASAVISLLVECPLLPQQNSDFDEINAMLSELPISKYALRRKETNYFDFFEVVQRKNGRRFINRLIGAPGSWRRMRMSIRLQKSALRAIKMNPHGAAIAYAQNFTRCSVCDSPLSDPASIERSMGPICAKRFM